MSEVRTRLIDRHVGESLHMRRISVGMSQTELARGLGVTYQQIQKYEHGKNRLSASALYKAAAALGVEPGYFFERLELDRETETAVHDVIKSFETMSPIFGLHEFVELNTAFRRIRNAKRRRALLGLIQGLALGNRVDVPGSPETVRRQ